jgi:hypothetical protein
MKGKYYGILQLFNLIPALYHVLTSTVNYPYFNGFSFLTLKGAKMVRVDEEKSQSLF